METIMRFLFRITFNALVLFVVYTIGYMQIGPTPEKILSESTRTAVHAYSYAKPYYNVAKDVVVQTINEQLEQKTTKEQKNVEN